MSTRRLTSQLEAMQKAPRHHANMALLGLSLRFSYSHLLFRPTLALPVDGVGVPGPVLEPLSPNKLLLKGLPPP